MRNRKALIAGLILIAVGAAYSALVTGTKSLEKSTYSLYATNTTGAASLTLTRGSRVEVTEVRMTLSAVGGSAENFTVTLDSGIGATFDNPQAGTTDMVAASSLNVKYDPPIQLAADDALVVAYANSNNKTWAIEIEYNLK